MANITKEEFEDFVKKEFPGREYKWNTMTKKEQVIFTFKRAQASTPRMNYTMSSLTVESGFILKEIDGGILGTGFMVI